MKTHVKGLIALLLCTTASLWANTTKPLWTAALPEKAKWHSLTQLGTLIVGTDGGLSCYNPDTGALLWRRQDITKTTAFNAREVPGTPILLCNNFGGFANSKVTLQAVDFLTGKTLWHSPEFQGQYLGTVPVPSKGLVIFIFNGWAEKEGAGTYFHAFDLATGAEKWTSKFAKSGAIQLHLADGSGKFFMTSDLSGYFDPICEGDNLYVAYLGVHCLDVNTGKVKWAVEFPPGDKGFKKTYAPLRITTDRIYGAGGGSVYAIDKADGKVLWKSERISKYAGLLKARNNAIISQIEPVGDKVFMRYGGFFSTGQAVVMREPLGVVALDAATGREAFANDDVKEGVTNLMVLPELNCVMFADAYNLYGLNVSGSTATEAFRVPIEFKRKMGGGEVAKIGLGVLGGVQGIVKASMAQSKGRLDVPIAITRRNGVIVVQGKQHLMCFDPGAKKIAWSTYCAAPGGGFGDAALFAVTALAAVAGNAQAAGSTIGSSQWDSGVNMIQSNLDSYNKYAGARASATKAAASRVYFLTNIKEGSDRGIGLMGIKLDGGESDAHLVLDSKEPDYRVDESVNRLFYFKDSKTIMAYSL